MLGSWVRVPAGSPLWPLVKLTLKNLKHMEILYFSLGAVTVALAYAVVGVFRLNRRLKRVAVRSKKGVSYVERGLDDISSRLDSEVNELYRTIDSRLDKLEHRLAN
jgi:hypothetical protein